MARCTRCGSEDIIGGYNYDTGQMNYVCNECDHAFTEGEMIHCDECGKQVVEDVDIAIEDDGFIFCSKHCIDKFYSK